MGFYLFKFKSMTYAQRASKFLSEKGIYTGIVKLPLRYSRDGCGYSLKISERQFLKAKALLKDTNYIIESIYHVSNNKYTEVV